MQVAMLERTRRGRCHASLPQAVPVSVKRYGLSQTINMMLGLGASLMQRWDTLRGGGGEPVGSGPSDVKARLDLLAHATLLKNVPCCCP